MSRLTSNAKQLTEQRKGRSRKPPAELASQSDLSQYDYTTDQLALVLIMSLTHFLLLCGCLLYCYRRSQKNAIDIQDSLTVSFKNDSIKN